MGASLQARPAPTETLADAQRSIVDRANGLSLMLTRIRTFAMAHVPGNFAGRGA